MLTPVPAANEDELDALYARGAAANAGIPLDRGAFLRHVTERAGASAISAVRAGDLYLALACALGNPDALARLDALVMPKVAHALGRFEPAVDSDDLLQKLRQRLLLPRGRRLPRIANYSGLGSLTQWARAIAVRLGLRMTRRARREASLGDEPLETLIAGDDPELKLLRAQCRHAFAAAFRGGFEALPASDRNVLRLHLLDGLSVDRIGALLGVARVSAWRRLDQARGRLEQGTRERLAREAQLCTSDIDHVLQMMQSQLAQSLRRLLSPTLESTAQHALPR